jgi:hypothetical protein
MPEKDMPYFLGYESTSDGDFICFKPVEKRTVSLDSQEVLKLIDPKGDKPRWIVAHGRANIVRGLILHKIPEHIAVAFKNDFSSNYVIKERRGRTRQHDLKVGLRTKCCGDAIGCTNTGFVGFDKDTLLSLQNDQPPPKVNITIVFSGACRHKRGFAYGQLRGPLREQIVQTFVESKKAPAEVMKDVLSTAGDVQVLTKNASLGPEGPTKTSGNAPSERNFFDLYRQGIEQ